MSNDPRSIKEHIADRNYINRKPCRTAAQKAEARRVARILDGHWVSSAPVSKHKGGGA